jgi:hypothetical protein
VGPPFSSAEAVLALGVTTAEAQEPIRVVGWVQWVSGKQ